MISEEERLNGSTKPHWLVSEKEFRGMLRERYNARETAPNLHGWTTLESLPRRPMFGNTLETAIVNGEQIVVYDPHSTRKHNPYGPAERAVTEREQAKVKAHIEGARRLRRTETT